MNTQRTFNAKGMLSAAPKQATAKPGAITVGGGHAVKPSGDYVIGNKARDEAIQAQKDQLAFQKEQLAEQKRQFELTYEMQKAGEARADLQSAQNTAQYNYNALYGNAKPKSGKVICSAFYVLGYMDEYIYRADQKFAEKVHPDFMKWYQSWAYLFVARMHGETLASRIFIDLLWILTEPWSREMAYQMGVAERGSWFGRLEMKMASLLFKLKKVKMSSV